MIRAGVRGLVLAVAGLTAAEGVAGIRYEFRQNTRSEVRQIPSLETQGVAWLDGDRMRIDYQGPSGYGDNASVVTSGNRTLWILDREARTFYDINLNNYARNLASAPITVTNVRSNVENGPGPQIAGFPTQHWKLMTSYDMRITMGEIVLEQRVETTIEKWTTQAFGEVTDPLAADEGLRTGNPELDKLIEIETTKVTGFPLRQAVTITTRDIKPQRRTRREIDLTVPRRQSSETIITKIEFAEPQSSTFTIPDGFRKIDPATRSGIAAVTLTP